MVKDSRTSALRIVANEGHVGDIVLLRAVDSLFDEQGGPLTAAAIAATLFAHGFPAGNPRLLRYDVASMLRKHPHSFRQGDSGWCRLAAGPNA